MLDNKILSEFGQDTVVHSSYEYKVRRYDEHCAQCPFNLIRIMMNKRVIKEVHNIQDGIDFYLDLEGEGAHLERLCNFGGEEYSLVEIVINSCRLWNTDEYDEGVFIEVNNIDDLKIDSWLAKVGDLDVELTMAELGIK